MNIQTNNIVSYTPFLSSIKTDKKCNYRVKSYSRNISTADKTKAFAGSTIGTMIPILLMMKKQKVKNPLKLQYGMWDKIF